MRNTLIFLMMAMIILAACQPKPKTVPVDTAAAKDSVSTLLDKFNSAMKAKDANTIAALITEDGLICGTDPSEFWDKSRFVEEWKKAAADTSVKFTYSIDKQEIRIASDGNSAIAIEQAILASLSPKIPFRLVYHAVKTGDKWLIDFASWNFIPKNEDIPKLNKALE